MGNPKKTNNMEKQRIKQIELAHLPPQAIDLEEAVLGAILVDGTALDHLDALKPEYFYKIEHNLVFRAVLALNGSGKKVDILTVTDHLRSMGELDTVGGAYFVTTLADRVASAAHIEHHIFILKQKYIRRALIEMSQRTMRNAYDESIDELELLADHENEVENLGVSTITRDAEQIGNIIDRIFTSAVTESGVPVVMPGLRDKVKKFQNSDLIILAARPSMGKTAKAIQLALQTAQQGIPVGIFSLEMSKDQLVTRMLTNLTGIEYMRILNKEYSRDEAEMLAVAGRELANLKIYIDDTAGMTEQQFRARALRMHRKYGIGFIVLDYLQLMSVGGKVNNREQEISQISRKLKQVAKEINIPVMALSQLSRKCEDRTDKKPMLSDLRESGAIEQDADCVMFLYRPEYYGITDIQQDGIFYSSAGICETIIAKNRNGKCGSTFSEFSGFSMTFRECSLNQVEKKQTNFI